tara:strand:- start:699 stop:1244 length:546 start_codon:yes stop_codon:yes gene_type:complete
MKNGYEIVKKFIDPSFAEYLQNYFTVISKNGLCTQGDDQAPNSYCVYGDPAFDTLMVMTSPIVENFLKKRVLPQYTYARIYFQDSILEKHTDRPECEISVTLSLGGVYNHLWPICIEDYDGNENCVELNVGDAMIYYGRDLEHWRNKFNGVSQYQVFFHYVYADGKYKDRLFDGRPNIGLP